MKVERFDESEVDRTFCVGKGKWINQLEGVFRVKKWKRGLTKIKHVDLENKKKKGTGVNDVFPKPQTKVETDLKEIAKVDQHMMRLLHPTRHIQTTSDHMARLPPFCKVCRHGEVEPSDGGVGDPLG